MNKSIPEKANTVLQILLLLFVFIGLRVAQLSILEYDKRLVSVYNSQKKSSMIPAVRGAIADCNNMALAYNKVQYDIAICYADIRAEVPAITWNKKNKSYPRREYIAKLSSFLSTLLNLSEERISDLIYGRAALTQKIPFILQKNISEEVFYQLKINESKWPGIQLQINPRRFYPFEKLGCDVLGYMGAISPEKYHQILLELAYLETAIDKYYENDMVDETLESLKMRMHTLKERAYSCNALVGQSGIEAMYEEELRGAFGEIAYIKTAKGEVLQTLPGKRKAMTGQRIVLSLNASLQAYAEQLLIESDASRSFNVAESSYRKRTVLKKRAPWIKGGAIVALDPRNGHVLALASYPRTNPNDFVGGGGLQGVDKWLEKSSYIASVWEGRDVLEREYFDKESKEIKLEEKILTYDHYIEALIPEESELYSQLKKPWTIQEIVVLYNQIKLLQNMTTCTSFSSIIDYMYKEEDGHRLCGRSLLISERDALYHQLSENSFVLEEIKERLDPYFCDLSSNYNKLLFIDLMELFIDAEKFSSDLQESVGSHTVEMYRELEQSHCLLKQSIYEEIRRQFSKIFFKPWRENHQKAFLKNIRREEKQIGVSYPLSYLDYLEAQEDVFFQKFWKENQDQLLMSILFPEIKMDESLLPYVAQFPQECLSVVHKTKLLNVLKNLSNEKGALYLQTMRSFQDLNKPLKGHYKILSQQSQRPLQKHLAASFYPIYGFGYGRSFAFRQATTPGSIFKLVTAYEALQQKKRDVGYLSDPLQLNPMTVTDMQFYIGKTKYLGYTEEGKAVPEWYKGGRVLKSYRHSMGKLDILQAIKKSSNFYFSLLAGDYLKDPNDLTLAALKLGCGEVTNIDLPFEYPGFVPTDLSSNRSGLLSMSCGQHSLLVTPLQAANFFGAIANGGTIFQPKMVLLKASETEDGIYLVEEDEPFVNDEIDLPKDVQAMLFEGMRMASESRQRSDRPLFIGKSGTAEAVEWNNLDEDLGHGKYHHIWYGAIVFNEKDKSVNFLDINQEKVPELIVIVYLRYGTWGRDAGLVAEQMVNKWAELCQ